MQQLAWHLCNSRRLGFISSSLGCSSCLGFQNVCFCSSFAAMASEAVWAATLAAEAVSDSAVPCCLGCCSCLGYCRCQGFSDISCCFGCIGCLDFSICLGFFNSLCSSSNIFYGSSPSYISCFGSTAALASAAAVLASAAALAFAAVLASANSWLQ